MSKKNCAFQYAYKDWSGYHTPEDTGLITLVAAKELWRKWLPDFIKQLKAENSPEMAIWINMKDPIDYRETLEHINYEAVERNGRIYEVKERLVEV